MNPIEVIFSGKDETKAAVASVKEGLDSIAGSSTQANEQLASMNTILGSQEMRAWKDAAVDAFKVAGAAAMQFVDAAAEAELVGVRMEATIKALGDRAPTTAGNINELADELSKLTGFDDEALVEAQATLARMGSVSKDNFERATRAATDLAAATGMDLKSAFQSVGMAMENADFGRLARQIGDLPPEMQEAAKAALKMGDTLKVQEIILSGIEQKVDGAGEAIGETFTGQMNKLRTEYGNFQESVGLPLINLFTNLPDSVKTAGFAIYSLGGQFGPVLSSVADLAIATRGLNAALGGKGLVGLLGQIRILGATAFGPMLIQLGLVAIAVGAVLAVWHQWNEQIVKTNEEGKKAVQSAWEKFFADLEASGASAKEILAAYRAAQERTNQVMEDTNPIVRAFVFNKKDLVEADKELEASLIRVTGSQEEAKRLMAETNTTMAQSGKVAAQTTQDIDTAGATFKQFWADIPKTISFTLQQAGQSASMIGTIINLAFQQLVKNAAVGFSLMVIEATKSSQMLVKIVQVAWQRIWQTVRDWFSRIVQNVRQFWSDIKAAFQRVIDDAKNWGLGIVNGIWQGILDGWASLKLKIETLAQSLPQWIKDALNITSPSKVMAKEVGLPIAEGIGLGFQQGMKKIKPMFNVQPGGLGFTPSPAFARANIGTLSGGGGATITGNTFQFYSPLTHDERRRIRKEQEDAAQRELLRSLR